MTSNFPKKSTARGSPNGCSATFRDTAISIDRLLHPELCVCVACRVTLKIGESAGNINKHFATGEHQAKINSGHLDEFGGAVERTTDLLLEICEFGRPFTLVDSPHMASLVRSPFRLNATTARQLLCRPVA
jgi:hypothetical protein